MKPIPFFLLFAFAPALDCPAAEATRPADPNVVLILTDDLGWQDVKCYDIDDPSPYETPNMDALAKKGVLFWQAYSPAPTCAPSRCAILSGNHPARAQKTHVVGGAPPAPNSKKGSRVMEPWYSGRMPAGEMTLAKVLQENGYVTGHSGKWHMAIDHNAFPQPMDQGFTWTRKDRGVTVGMEPNRLTGFATEAADDPFRLDGNGHPFDQTSQDAVTFLRESQGKPFFLYLATWLVHAPIHSRDRALLEKYCRKLGVDFPTDPDHWEVEGQNNPYYCAMVELLDYYIGQVIAHLENTEDPRWPGHKLSENTYVIFTSDNGGMEGHPGEIITDNYPLDRGKISAREGGTRVPLLISGPGIKAGVQSDVMVNGLDFYPTILSLTGIDVPAEKHLDGCDLAPLLLGDVTDASLVKHSDGSVRDTMVWHFPHGGDAMESTIRIGGYKLIHRYDHIANPKVNSEYELFHLYETTDGKQSRKDIEEAHNLVDSLPGKAQEMAAELKAALTEMKASYPSLNPDCLAALPHKENVCTVLTHHLQGNEIEFRYQENGARVTQADLIYTLNGGEKYEEWFRIPASLKGDGKVTAEFPEGTTHLYLNLVDENQFLRSYPEVIAKGKSFAGSAVSVQSDTVSPSRPVAKKANATKGDRNLPFNRWDTNKDDILTLEEYLKGQTGENLEQRFKNFDKNGDGTVSREEYVIQSAK
ncbi:MAG TPA: sulfatase-like hydrolase/transferase [Verrucomicrobiales bacterium]|jgi:arylsulfatase A-like enzyme|nr:sulfatase-like hydrolase/transferase [Verrucomicrobiales bacterium]